MTDYLDDVIDVSDAQSTIDWPAVAAAGIRVAFVKAVEGHTFEAHTFVRNREAALAAGLTVIPYDFLRPGYQDAAIAFFADVAELDPGSLAALDWEGRAADTCSPAEAEAIGDAILGLTGRNPVGYWGIPGSTPALPTPKMAAWPRWVPRYPRQGAQSFAALAGVPLSDWPGARFAQYTKWGKVPGITGPVDRSIWIGTQAERDAFFQGAPST